MRGILNFFQQNPVLGIVIAISLLLLNIGIWILRNPAPLPVDLPSSDASQRQLEIPALPETGGEGQNIDSLQSTVLNFNATSMSEASKLSPRELDKAIAEAEKVAKSGAI